MIPRFLTSIAAIALMTLSVSRAAAGETIQLFAAGSLKPAMTEMARTYEAKNNGHVKVATEFGASGLLRERIEKGEKAHIFASADVGHPTRIADQGKSQGGIRIFTRNALCALAREDLAIDSAKLVEVLLDPATRVGISTPKADPAGDYALKFFDLVEKARAGDGEKLRNKALQLTGGPASQKAPEGRSTYGWLVSTGQADVFVTYCTNTAAARKDTPALKVIDLPTEFTVHADYALVTLDGAPQAASGLVQFIMGPEGQSILAKYGFAPTLDR